MTQNKTIKKYKLSEAKDLLIGEKGSPLRNEYESELKTEIIGDMIKMARKDRNLTQSQLGDMVGVKKSQISRLENNTKNVTVGTILKIFNALKVQVNFSVQL